MSNKEIIADKNNDEDISAAELAFEKIANDNISLSFFNSDLLSQEKNLIKINKKIWKPRPYQQKMYEEALNHNSIILAETGKGKTFVSIMLMANHLGIDIKKYEKRPKIDKNKKIIFFVCDTALINQQKKHIEEILNIEVGTIQGKKDKKSKSDYETFINKWNSYNVFVAIPEIIYKILSCGFINIFQISMLVFDECHNTTEDHPYNKIMKEFYFFYKNENIIDENKYKFPLIYGLTASPIKTSINENSYLSNTKEALIKLSENLDCDFIIDPEMINFEDEINQNKNDYVEVKTCFKSTDYKNIIVELYNHFFIAFASSAFSYFPDKYKIYKDKQYLKAYLKYVISKFEQKNLVDYNNICQEKILLYNLRKVNKLLFIFENIQRDIFLILENLSLEALIIYFDESIQLYDKLYQKKLEEEEKDKHSEDSLSSDENEDNELDEEIILNFDSELILEIKNYLLLINTELKTKNSNHELNYVSDRLGQLFNEIKKLFLEDENSKIIIFITHRIIAHILKPTLSNYLKEKFPKKKCEEIIGVNKKNKKSNFTLTPTISLNKLNQVVKDFNEKSFDILIGTSAIEEGLDIQSCNAVISLVEIQTPKSYIQMKGRARKSKSKFIIFSYDKDETFKKIRQFLEIGIKMKELFNNEIKKNFRRDNYINEKDIFRCCFIENTHAKLTPKNATVFFNEIKQQMDNYKILFALDIKINAVGYSNQKFIGKFEIKTNLKDFEIKGPKETDICNSKDEAKKMCHYFVLINLIENKYLDEHLKFSKEKRKNQILFELFQ